MASILESSAGAEGYHVLTSRHSVILDAKGCRTLTKPSCHIGDGPAPTNALEALRSHAGQFDEAYATELARRAQFLNLEAKAEVVQAFARAGQSPSALEPLTRGL